MCEKGRQDGQLPTRGKPASSRGVSSDGCTVSAITGGMAVRHAVVVDMSTTRNDIIGGSRGLQKVFDEVFSGQSIMARLKMQS